jgi:hypothetical protein
MTARIDMRAEPEWVAAVEEAGRRLGLNVSAYIRLATSERLARDGLTPPKPAGGDEPPAPGRRKGR